LFISTEYLKNNLKVSPSGIIHVGAHLGEERFDYLKCFKDTLIALIWVEAQAPLCEGLKLKIDGQIPYEIVINALIYDSNNERKDLNIASNSQSSSMLEFGTHSDLYPSIVYQDKITMETKRLDFVLESIDCKTTFDFINLDIQGVELNALRSLGEYISKIRWIYTEVNFQMVYEGTNHISEIDDFLNEFGFRRILTQKANRGGWGDAFYVKNPSKLIRLQASIYEWQLVLRNIKRKLILQFHSIYRYYRRKSRLRFLGKM
jgi:FkbM family methyltransferase